MIQERTCSFELHADRAGNGTVAMTVQVASADVIQNLPVALWLPRVSPGPVQVTVKTELIVATPPAAAPTLRDQLEELLRRHHVDSARIQANEVLRLLDATENLPDAVSAEREPEDAGDWDDWDEE